VDINTIIDQTKVNFILDKPRSTFLTSLLCSVEIVVTKAIPTLAINPYKMMINPDFFEALTPNQRKTAMAHEVQHLALMHCDIERQGERNAKKWNYAGDYVINLALVNAGFDEIPGWLYDTQYENMSTEEVYELLPDGEKPNSLGEDIQAGKGNPSDDPDSKSPSPQEIKEKLEQLILKAAVQSEMAGENIAGMVPSDVLRTIDSIRNPIIPWQELLMQYMLDYDKSDYTMARPNRRYMPDFILPSLHNESIGNVMFICDASGSIGQKEFEKFYSEGIAAREILNPTKFTIASFDTKIQSLFEYHKEEYMDCPKLAGGGGTAIMPVLKLIEDTQPDVAVIFTDGYFYDHRGYESIENTVPIIWLIDSNPNFNAPFGDIIHFVE